MAVPRFLFAEVETGGPPAVVWRLVGANNHDLGRSPLGLPDLGAAQEAVRGLRAAADDLLVGIPRGSGPGRWGWHLSLDGTTVAVSSRWFSRQRECTYNVEAFLVTLPAAEGATTTTSFRRYRSTALALHPPAVP